MKYEDIRNLVLSPWWCWPHHPLSWTTPQGVGLSKWALDGHVGRFNLGWFVLNCEEPPRAQVYYDTNLMWAIMGDHNKVEGKPLSHHAAMMGPLQFRVFMTRHLISNPQVFAYNGMTTEKLWSLVDPEWTRT
jgi:hypothetical protein